MLPDVVTGWDVLLDDMLPNDDDILGSIPVVEIPGSSLMDRGW